MRVVLASMNEIGAEALEALVEFVEVAALFTPKERGKAYMDPMDFTDLARKHGVPLIRIADINSPEVEERLRALKPEIGFSLGWKQIIKKNVLEIPRLSWIGGHPAKLLLKGEKADPKVFSAPGNEPMNYAILGGFERSGMSLCWLDRRIDAGEVFSRGEVEIDIAHETSRTLLGKIARLTGKLLRESLPALIAGHPPRLPQETAGLQPYTKPLKADDNRVDLSAPIEQTCRLIRSCVYPYPNAFIEFHGQRIYIERARLEGGVFTKLKVRAGGSAYAKEGLSCAGEGIRNSA